MLPKTFSECSVAAVNVAMGRDAPSCKFRDRLEGWERHPVSFRSVTSTVVTRGDG